MFAALRRAAHLERTNLELSAKLRAAKQAILTLRTGMEDALRRHDDILKAYKALYAECHGLPRENVTKVLEGIIDTLSFAEWATPEHAEEILVELIDVHHPKGVAALCAEGV